MVRGCSALYNFICGLRKGLFVNLVISIRRSSTITSDRGPQFVSSTWSSLCDLVGIKRAPTTTYHPQANGLVERFHQQFKNSFRARLAGPDWSSHLPWVLLGLRIAPKEASNVSSAELVYGSTLAVPGDFLGATEAPADPFLHGIHTALSQQASSTPPI